MLWLWILLAVLGVIVLLAAVVLIRAAVLKPTPAVTAVPTKGDPARSKQYAETLSRMVREETVSSRYDEDRSKFLEFHKVLEELFPNIHKTCEKHVFNGSLLFKWPGQGKGDPILFMSHHDVVEAGGKWEQEPFGGKIVDGAVWGRGTVDTKGSLFCFLTAAEEMMKEGYVPACDVYLASSCTEEWSGEGAPLTVQYLKENGVKLGMLIDEGGMIMEEPIGGVKGTYAMVGVLEKGYGDVKFIAKGKGGHASAPMPHTPLARLASFICEVEKHYPFRSEFNPTVQEMFRRVMPNMNFGMKVVFANLWLFKPLLKKLMPSISPAGAAMLRTTIAFTTAKGSDGLNVLPQEAYVTGNLRFIPHQGTDESISLISELAKKYDIDTEVIYKDYPCPVVDYTGSAFLSVEKAINEIYPGVGVSPYVMTGGTDAKFYKDICNDCIRFAPLAITKQQYESIHGLNENINCNALPPGVDFYKLIVKMQEK
ncbi:M20/M25/M40 family metallo-hydrolase [Anaerolentibacter hominis]|uniref:M20/M25/M40 family metallo-hydrolase n=1 Tax=Anaerolentibacter hominis TaxID=3079009 RepID=UPI0031B88BBA